MLNELIVLFFLTFSRITGIFLLLPVFGNRTIPTPIKIGFSFFLTYVTLPLIRAKELYIIDSFDALPLLFISEFVIGLIFGFISFLLINSIYLTGLIVDYMIGFSMVSIINPEDETETPITANLFYILAILIFFIANFHHKLIISIAYSLEKIPIGSNFLKLISPELVIEILQTSFVFGFKMAAPILVTILISDLLLGILSRAMPQMNVFIVGMPLKILIGLLALFIVFPSFIKLINNIFTRMFDYINIFLSNTIK